LSDNGQASDPGVKYTYGQFFGMHWKKSFTGGSASKQNRPWKTRIYSIARMILL
jgi:hypothetical protein